MDWIQKYKYTDQTWLVDSLNWDRFTILSLQDNILVSFLTNSSFLNHHLILDSSSKLSYLDVLLIISSGRNYDIATLYNSFLHDGYIIFTLRYFNILPSFLSANQDLFTVSLIFTPELMLALNEYFNSFYSFFFLNSVATACFDSYTSSMTYSIQEGLSSLFLFFLFSWFVIYFFLSSVSLLWSKLNAGQPIRGYLYFFSLSREVRIQFEATTQTAIFFILYWSMTIMSFDDDKEELIEYLDTSFFYFFSFVLIYFFFKHSVHYFSFLESTSAGSRSTMFMATQFKGDFLALFSMILRFYSLLLRLNVYDVLDDCLDFYYVFIGDFDDDEYMNESFFSLYGVIFYTSDNQDDRSFLLEDENDFYGDLFYLYFLLWGKVFYFLFYTVELTARFGLAFYVIYLVLFEIYGVNCSYKEDSYFLNKR